MFKKATSLQYLCQHYRGIGCGILPKHPIYRESRSKRELTRNCKGPQTAGPSVPLSAAQQRGRPPGTMTPSQETYPVVHTLNRLSRSKALLNMNPGKPQPPLIGPPARSAQAPQTGELIVRCPSRTPLSRNELQILFRTLNGHFISVFLCPTFLYL